MVPTGTIEGCRPLSHEHVRQPQYKSVESFGKRLIHWHYFTVKWQQQKKNPNVASAAERMKIFNFYPHGGFAGTLGDPSRVQKWTSHRTDGSEETSGGGCFADDDMTSADGFFFLRVQLRHLPSLHVPLPEALLISCYYKITRLEKKCTMYFVNLLLNIISQ